VNAEQASKKNCRRLTLELLQKEGIDQLNRGLTFGLVQQTGALQFQ